MRDYGKVFCTFWTSEDTRGLSDDGKLLALYLLTTSHANIIGCYRLPNAYACDDIGWTSERVSKGFRELLANGFATRHEKSQWVVVHKFLRWNQIENPNQAKAAKKAAESIPESSCVRGLMAATLKQFCKYSEGWIDNHSRTLPEPFRNPDETVSKPETGAGTGAGTEIPAADAPVPTIAGKPPKTQAVTMKTWLDNLPDDTPVISPDDPIFTWAKKTGVPEDFMALSWEAFVGRYMSKPKKYKDWRAVWRTAVQDNWLKLWYIDRDGNYALTTVGVQAKRVAA